MQDMPQEQAPAEGQAPAESGGVAEFVQNLGQGLSTLAEMVGKTEGAPPEAAQLVEGILGQFDQLIQVMQGGGAPQEPQSQAPQKVPVDQPEGTPV